MMWENPMSPPLKLTDRQLASISDAARGLRPADRDKFLRTIAESLAGREVGDGSVSMAVRAAMAMMRDERQGWLSP
jgi:hypothetical protein